MVKYVFILSLFYFTSGISYEAIAHHHRPPVSVETNSEADVANIAGRCADLYTTYDLRPCLAEIKVENHLIAGNSLAFFAFSTIDA